MRMGLGLQMIGGARGGGRFRRENLFVQSQAFGTSWTKNPAGLTITADTTVAPDGTTTADTITDTADGGNTQHFVDQAAGGSPTNGSILVASVFAKAGTKSVIAVCPNNAGTGYTFNLSTGAVGAQVNSAPLDQGIVNVGNGWYRCWVKFTYASGTPSTRIYMANSTASVLYTGTGTGTVILWGAQLNTTLLRRYTPTGAAIVT